jgi:hypothetical protein
MIALFSMPEDPEALSRWLDEQLVGPHLHDLVAELQAVHRPGPAPQLRAVLGGHWNAFLERGFAALPPQVVSELLRNPSLLPELAERVFEEGDHHWFGTVLSPEEEARARRVAAAVGAQRRAGAAKSLRLRLWFSHFGVALATAAVLVAVNLGGGLRTPAPAPSPSWGFAKVHQLARGEPKSTFRALADLAQEWKNKPTDDRASLARRLSEFRLGCSTLQATDLGLPADEARWLKLRCLDWSAAIDRHLRELDETGDVAAVRAAALETINGIVAELRQRAA